MTLQWKNSDDKYILNLLKDKGYNTNKLRKDTILSENCIQKLRDNEVVGTTSLGHICDLLECQPGDILINVPGNTKKISDMDKEQKGTD